MGYVSSALIAVAVAGFSFSASAADIPVKAPPRPAAVLYSWTGFYIGGNVGWVQQKDDGDTNFFSANSPAIQTNNRQSNSLDDRSLIAGAQAGFNWQIDRLVLGVEGDWSWLDTKNRFCRQTDFFSLPCSDNAFGFLTLNSSTDWLATVRGRVGIAFDRLLIYGTGGVAWGKVDTSINASCLVLGCGFSTLRLNTTATFSETKSGWVAGGGAEAMLTPNLTVRAEYLHVDLGTVTNTLNLVGDAVPNSPQSATWSRNVTYDIVRFGANYKFGP